MSVPGSPLAMTDEDFLKLNSPDDIQAQQQQDPAAPGTAAPDAGVVAVETPAAAPAQADAGQPTEASADQGGNQVPGSTPNEGVDPVVAAAAANAAAATAASNATPGATATAVAAPADGQTQEGGDSAVGAEGENAGEADNTPVNYEEFYKTIMKPFKANGKTIELRSPDEAIGLMQMGANYTKKLQELQPHRKMVMMLQDNGLLDEGKLSFLIDLERKNPEAIKKLIKESGIDPLSIDTESEPAYTEGSHRISDRDVNFRTQLEEVGASEDGQKFLVEIDKSWDKVSKEALWENPEVLTVLAQQRESGVYATITGELDRRRTLGLIPPSVPFIQAYKIVGDELAAANGFAHLAKGDNAITDPAPVVVAERVATPKPPVTNGDKASAAAPTKGAAPAKGTPAVNFLAMSDDEFLKNMAGRL